MDSSLREKRHWRLRVIDPAFPENNIYRKQAKQTVSLGPVMVATVAKEWCHWLGSAEVINENNYRSIRRRAPVDENGMPDHLILQKDVPADFIGISCCMSTATPRALELIRFYKSLPAELRPKAILVGGWHAMDNAEEFLQAGADVVVHGEIEPIVVDLMTALRDDKSLENIHGISYRVDNQIKRNSPDEIYIPQEMMDSLPHPNFNLVRYAIVSLYPAGRTRGCSGKCTFCRVKCQPRWTSPERFFEQIMILASKGAKHIFITDDRSEEDREGFIKFLQLCAQARQEGRLRIGMTVQARLSAAQHPDLLKLMWDAGINNVCIGYESPIPIQLAAMKKPIRPQEMLNWTKIWKSYGFAIHMMLIFGYPLSPEARRRLQEQGKSFRMSAKEMAQIFWKFIKQANPHTLQVLMYTPLPGTEDRKFLEDEGRLLPLGWECYDGMLLAFVPDEGIDPEELQKEYIKLMRKFYAFRYLWPLGFVPLIIHAINVGFVTISYPFVRPIIGSRPWSRIWRNSLRRFGANIIVLAWLKQFRQLHFTEKLRSLISRKKII